MTSRCASPTALTIIDLVTNPLRPGKAEMERAPMMQNTVVSGIDLCSPPSSEALMVPVR